MEGQVPRLTNERPLTNRGDSLGGASKNLASPSRRGTRGPNLT